jgi:hypothetical protein
MIEHRYPKPSTPPVTPTEVMNGLMHDPERMLVPELEAYPHTCTSICCPNISARATAVHLGMVTANSAARAFYDRLGFHEIPVPDPGPLTYLGRGTGR